MKQKIKQLMYFSVVVLITATIFTSCDNGEIYPDIRYPNAIVTVKTDSADRMFLQLDDNTTLLPVNVRKSPYERDEVRALVNYYQVRDSSYQYSKAIYLNWMDSIRTKDAVKSQGDDDDKLYGFDPVEIVNSWLTVSEDGYLTLQFRTIWGNTCTLHEVNLLTGVNPDDPYEVEFRHNANGDRYGYYADALVAFDLKSLPDTNGETVKLRLKWKSFSGTKSTVFGFNSRKSDGQTVIQINDREFKTEFK